MIGLFDAEAAARIAALRRRVAGDEAFPPHLTFAVYDDLTPRALARRLAALPARRPIRLRFPALGLFPASGVLHLSPAASAALTALHGAVHRAVKAPGRPHFRPGEWAPHCTLANGREPAALGAGAATLAADFPILQATLQALAIVEFPPPRLHRRFPLGGAT